MVSADDGDPHPNPQGARSLPVDAQNSSSISLPWEWLVDSDSQNLTYLIQWTGDGNSSETLRTTDTNVTVEGLRPGTSHVFSVGGGEDRVNRETVSATTGEGSQYFRRV